MVKVREDQPIQEDGSVNIEAWIERVTRFDDVNDLSTITKACSFAKNALDEAIVKDPVWADRVPCSYKTGLEMAEILAELRMDEESLVAAILYRTVREEFATVADIRREFGDNVADLVEGVLQMANIGNMLNPSMDVVLGKSDGQLEKVRKMLVTLIDDVRVALIKLAERTCAIRVVTHVDKKRRYRTAREVFDVYAPLAHRLGIGHIKWELEDLSFRYLQPAPYKKIAGLLDEKRLNRQEFIDDVLTTLSQQLDRMGIEADLSGRAKHIYSIWRKMQRKNIDFHQVYDVRGVRILVPEVRDCYAVLGVVHGLWKNIPHEFDDYIASPKENGYRSLHTAVIGPEGKVLEIQIRTHEMHEDAELGVCAHWLYKGTDTKSKKDSYEDKISWLRHVLEWHDDVGNSSELASEFRHSVEEDRIYAFTPDGHVVDLATGATPLDFAYRVHTEIGHRCRGAKINGKIVSLNTHLNTGDQVEILTGKESHPRRDWLNQNLGYVTTGRARAKIRHWFKEQDREQNLSAGRHMVERELRRFALDDISFTELAEKLNYPNEEEMMIALGAGDLRLTQIINGAQRQLEGLKHNEQLDFAFTPSKRKATKDPGEVTINGVGNLLSIIASCCKPVPGDAIVGFITQGRGVSIHRRDCGNAVRLEAVEQERIIQVEWGDNNAEKSYSVDIVIEAYDRSGLLGDVMTVMANEKLNITAVNTKTDKSEKVARMLVTVEIRRLEQLGRAMDKIHQLPNISDVRRQLAPSVQCIE